MGYGTADIHMHTSCSDGFSTPERLAMHLLGLDLDVVAVTDHDTIEGSLRVRDALRGRGPEVVVGEEVSTSQGHVLGLYLAKRVKPGMTAAATIDAIHHQGGLAVAAHPFQFPWAEGRSIVLGVGRLAWQLPFDAVEVVNGAPAMEFVNMRARRQAARAGRPSVGGSDAHVIGGVGHVHTVFEGTTAAELRRGIETGNVRPATRQVRRALATPGHVAWLVGRHPLRRVAGPEFMTPRLRWGSGDHAAGS
ncbi:MAG: CehA/McbA family metallohydrolase [Candidatus Dormibacteria bacterium]